MNPDYLDFEQPIAKLREQIEELRGVSDQDINLRLLGIRNAPTHWILLLVCALTFRSCTAIECTLMIMPQ